MAERNQLQMSVSMQADTPPESPTSTQAHLPNVKRITIDDNGVHNFDLRRRSDNSIPTRKLQKSARRINSSSISSMSDIRRTSSDGSDTGSIRKRISSLIVGKPDLQKANSTRSTTSSVEIAEDPMPDTKQELEIRLNYHLAELDMLKKTIAAANDTIREHADRYHILQTRSTSDMRCAMQVQEDLIAQARANRDAWSAFVNFHRRQLDRIKFRRFQIEEQAGVVATLPQVYETLWSDDDWARLFLV